MLQRTLRRLHSQQLWVPFRTFLWGLVTWKLAPAIATGELQLTRTLSPVNMAFSVFSLEEMLLLCHVRKTLVKEEFRLIRSKKTASG
jgi:hypothetical protein